MFDFNSAEAQQGQAPQQDQLQAMADDLNAAVDKAVDQVENEYANVQDEIPEGAEVPFFLSSQGIETVQKDGVHYAYGFINGEKFEVQCDVQVMVKKEIKEVFKSHLLKMKDAGAFADSLKAKQ